MTADEPAVPPPLLPTQSFDVVCRSVLDYLVRTYPMGMWAVTRVSGDRLILVRKHSNGFFDEADEGDQIDFESAMCAPMSRGEGPSVAPDVRTVPAYADLPLAQVVRSYVGWPIVYPDGRLFGTVCGYDPDVKGSDWLAVEPLLRLLTNLLSAVLAADSAATESARESELAARLADTDGLTGLLNRRGWERFIRVEEDRFRRFGDQVLVIVLDLDGLKQVNDARGHAAGDDYLKLAADVLTGALRTGDVIARLGGDEFGVVAVGVDTSHASLLIARLEQELSAAGVDGSFGFASYQPTHGLAGAVARADEAMYLRKRARRAGHSPGSTPAGHDAPPTRPSPVP